MSIGSVEGSSSFQASPVNLKSVRDAIAESKQIALSSNKDTVQGPVSAARPPRPAGDTIFAMLREQEMMGGVEQAAEAGLAVLYTQTPLSLAMQGVALTSLFSSSA